MAASLFSGLILVVLVCTARDGLWVCPLWFATCGLNPQHLQLGVLDSVARAICVDSKQWALIESEASWPASGSKYINLAYSKKLCLIVHVYG